MLILSDVPQHIATDRILFAVGGEESDHSFRLLKRLNQEGVVEATVVESDDLGGARRKRS
ncbi:MAG TPA: hypothetical protein VJW20_20775 [Candidatus Angelobacter sp.]|nr:hypothetical protein [Candidatus Angelobacter sp.]